MADKITYTDTLTIGFKRPDGSFQKFNIPEPKDDLTESSIKSQMTTLMSYNVFVDSKNTSKTINTNNGYSAGTAYRTKTTIRELDLDMY